MAIWEKVEEDSSAGRSLVVSSNGQKKASDWLLAPITDFRGQYVGYVEHIHDLTTMHTLLESLKDWFAEEDLKATGTAILDYIRGQGFEWCQLFLEPISNSDKPLVRAP